MARAVDPGLAGTPECSQPIPPAMLRTRYERVLRRFPSVRAGAVAGIGREGQPVAGDAGVSPGGPARRAATRSSSRRPNSRPAST